MLADTIQTFGVVLVVLAAAGYLMVVLRRSWRHGGGCGSCASKKLPFSTGACAPTPPGEAAKADRVPSQQIISVDRLADSARGVGSESGDRSADPPGQVS